VAAHPLTRPGTYALIITLDRPRIIDVGRRGRFRFPAGFYLYVGSALGPGGLAGRLERHLRADKRLHWHVDYLLCRARVVQVWIAESAARRECDWAQAAMRLPEATIILPRFGASDCRCISHLSAFTVLPDRELFAALTDDEVRLWAME
jgi:Uri superfamily endonuclease